MRIPYGMLPLDKFYVREDAVSLLVGRYTNMYPTCSENNYSSGYGKGDCMGQQLSTTFMEIQLLIAEDHVLNHLTEEELRHSLAWLATRIMEINDYQTFNQLYGEWHDLYRATFGKFFVVNPAIYAQLVLCLNDFIHEEL